MNELKAVSEKKGLNRLGLIITEIEEENHWDQSDWGCSLSTSIACTADSNKVKAFRKYMKKAEALIKKTLRYTNEKELYDFIDTHDPLCSSAFCVSGHACIMFDTKRFVTVVKGIEVLNPGANFHEEAYSAGRDLLGLTDHKSMWLFDGSRRWCEIWAFYSTDGKYTKGKRQVLEQASLDHPHSKWDFPGNIPAEIYRDAVEKLSGLEGLPVSPKAQSGRKS